MGSPAPLPEVADARSLLAAIDERRVALICRFVVRRLPCPQYGSSKREQEANLVETVSHDVERLASSTSQISVGLWLRDPTAEILVQRATR